MVEWGLFTIIDLLKGAKYILLYFIWRVGMIFIKKIQVLEEKNFHDFYYISLFILSLLHKP